MTIKKRIFSAVLAGAMALSTVPVMSATGFAATTTLGDKTNVYNLYPEYFCINGELDKNFIKVLEKAAGCDYDEITFGDLYKITSLDLSGLGLEGVPKIIEYMHRLRTLKLNDNNLRIVTNAEMEQYKKENTEIESMGAVNNLDLVDNYNLETVDLSDNYLTSVPAWYASLDIESKKINNNLIGTTNQRGIQLSSDTYYFMLGDAFYEDEFKDRLLSTLKLTDDTALPEYFFDPDLPTYDYPKKGDPDFDEEKDYEINTRVAIDLEVGKFVDDEVVEETGTANGVVSLIGTNGNNNTNFKFKVHFLDGNDPSTIKIRLEALVNECDDIEDDIYTKGSWKTFEASLDTAKTLLEYESADSEMLRDAMDDLIACKSSLVEGISGATKKTLSELIKISETFNEQDYTVESWKVFAEAVDVLKEVAENKDASIHSANDAIRSYQQAQKGLTTTIVARPAIIPKSEFESIYGENLTAFRRGTTRTGKKYSVTFKGTDVKTPADFNAEIIYGSEYEEKIRLQVGSASDYHLFSFVHEGLFPGTASVTMDVSDTYKDGTYRLYKWNTSTNESEFIKEVSIANGSVTIDMDNGGDYFISSVLQNFQMISANFDINHEKRTISSKFKNKYTVADFRNCLDNGQLVNILNEDGTTPLDTDRVATGMTAAAADSDAAYSIIVPGDIDGDGIVTALDAVGILRAIVGEISLEGYAVKAAADINGDGWVRVDDSVEILKYCVGVGD